MLDYFRPVGLFLLTFTGFAAAQQSATSGTFILHKFAKAIGSETYSIETKDSTYTLTSHFLFTDRGRKVPLETTFVARSGEMTPVSYSAKGQASRAYAMEDKLTVSGNSISATRSGKSQTLTPSSPWFITDGYSPVAMQEQMMRWWFRHAKPAEFTVYPSTAKVYIEPASTLTVGGVTAHGYTVSGFIWGQEALWIDDAQNLIALVSTDAEFDHFEAVRQPYEYGLGDFIASAVHSNLTSLAKLTATARMVPARKLAITGATLEDSTRAPPIKDSVILSKTASSRRLARGARSESRATPPSSMPPVNTPSPVFGTCTPTTSRSSGDPSISPPASPPYAM